MSALINRTIRVSSEGACAHKEPSKWYFTKVFLSESAEVTEYEVADIDDAILSLIWYL